MKKSHKIFIWTFIIAVLVAWSTFIAMRWSQEPQVSNDSFPVEVLQFRERLQDFVIGNFGQPIDSGFTAPMYLRAFPDLMEVDFDRVETSEGKYIYSNGELAFIRTQTKYISTFEEAILEKGHETLLSNLRIRFGNNFNVEEIVSRIIAQGVGNVSGTILRGPICPVMKDPPDEECADQPIFGDFIVKDVSGINEVARFSTQRNGSFMIPLPAGEYSIESVTPLGPGIQAHLIEVRTGETTEYTIIFDMGIR